MKRFKGLAIPYAIWLLFLFFLPLFVRFVLSFRDANGMDFSSAVASLENYQRLSDPSIYKAVLNSLLVALETVFFSFALGYPTAYFISFSKRKHKRLFLLLLILPRWSNSMLRFFSWLRLFSTDAFKALDLLGTNKAVVLVSVTTYLPFRIFPIYTVLEKRDRSLIEASRDLGVNSVKTFFKVTFPLSRKGVYSGILRVFLPSATEFAISQTIGQGKVRLIGNLIQSVFEKNNFGFGSLLSILLSLIIILRIFFFSKRGNRKGAKTNA